MMGGMGINSIEALRGNMLMLRGVGLNEKESSDSRHSACRRIKGETNETDYVDRKMVLGLAISVNIIVTFANSGSDDMDQSASTGVESNPRNRIESIASFIRGFVSGS